MTGNSREQLRDVWTHLPRPSRARVGSVVASTGIVAAGVPAVVAAQTSTAGTVCNSTGGNLIIALAYVVIGLSFVGVVTAAAAGAGLVSFGFLGRKIRSMGTTALFGAMIGMAILSIVLTVVGLAIAGIGVTPPDACLIPL